MKRICLFPRLQSAIRRSGVPGILVLLLTSGPGAAAQPAVTTERLLEEMTDLPGLAAFPQPAYTCKQFSSYDRKSKSPSEPDWFANGDAGHFLGVETNGGRAEFVMMDAPGPGAVVRVWSANPAGIIRIYLDGAPEPVLAAPMTDLLGGKFPGLPRPIAGEYSKGWNLYFPIPYARSCKITSDKGGFYYHVNYRTYEAGTPVETFQASQIESLAQSLQQLAARLESPESQPSRGQAEPFDLSLAPGRSVQREFQGPLAFSRIALRVDAANREAALRGIIVRASFDGEACVEAPLGDFFGSGPGLNPFSTLPLEMTAGGELRSRWFMPFKESAVIELVNHSSEDAAITGELTLEDYAWTERSLHFHAKWRAQWDVPTRPMIDWNYLAADGRGVFAGVSFTIDNPVRAWWGEGDEKIYVDGESFPSTFGTGTEDYYGYAWCWPGLFTHAYHSQSRCDGPGNYGRTSVNRFHLLDRIPFQKSIKFDMELWHWNERCRVNLGVMAYWYAAPGGRDAFAPVAARDAVVRPLPPYQPFRVEGAIEGESMRVIKADGGVTPQEWDGLSNDRHLWWHQGVKPGGALVLGFPAPAAGVYRVYARFMKARDYGIHQLSINGQAIDRPMDFYEPEVQMTVEALLGEFRLTKENNELVVKAVGTNPQAKPACMFGLDYVRLKPLANNPD